MQQNALRGNMGQNFYIPGQGSSVPFLGQQSSINALNMDIADQMQQHMNISSNSSSETFPQLL